MWPFATVCSITTAQALMTAAGAKKESWRIMGSCN